MWRPIVQWMFNNKMLTFLSVLSFSLSITVIALAVEKDNAWAEFERCQAAATPVPTEPPTTLAPVTEPPVTTLAPVTEPPVTTLAPETPAPTTLEPNTEESTPARRRRRHAKNIYSN